ncbi:MAG: SIR2 family protein [Nitrospirae bacterium]|nr:SIR2 family protein [Nitrospirota bacterium]
MIDENDLIKQLTTESFCIFVGSGISMSAGLPNGSELGEMILEALGVPEKDAEIIVKQYHLERMLFLMKKFLGDSIHEAYIALKSDNCTSNHYCLAKLNKEKKIPILTTNQDMLIEQAAGCNIQDFFKIHGSIDDPNSLRVTLDRVSSLPDEVSCKLTEMTKDRLIIVIGYSFSDYDLLDFFKSCRERIIYCSHIDNKEENENLKNIIWNNDQSSYNNHAFVSSAEVFLEKLSREFNLKLEDIQTNTSGIKTNIKDNLGKWAMSYPDYLKSMATISLHQGLWQGKNTYEGMIKIANDKTTPTFYRAIALTKAAVATTSFSSNKNHAQIQSKIFSDIKNISQTDKNIRMLLFSISKAERYHIIDNPIAWIKGLYYYRKTIRYLPRALDAVSNVNKKNILSSIQKDAEHGVSSCLEKLNRFYYRKKAINESKILIEKYITVLKPQCDLDFLCEVYFILAKIYIQLNNLNESEKFYSEALLIAKWIKKKHSIDQAHRGLGIVYGIKQEHDKALYHFKKSFTCAVDTHEELLQGRNYLSQTRLNLQLVRDTFKKGVNIYIKTYKGRIKGRIYALLYLMKGR